MLSVVLVAAHTAAILPGAAGAAGATPPRLLDPPPVRVDDYPSHSMINEEFGVVSVVLHISAEGKVASCDVTERSGFETLDKATCSLIRKRARFDPAKDANGSVIAGEYRMATAWSLPPKIAYSTKAITLQVSKLPTGYASPVKTRLLLDGSGHVVACEITSTSGSDAADRAACKYLRNFTVAPPKSALDKVPAMAVRYLTAELTDQQ